MSDLTLAFDALHGKLSTYNTLYAYAEGEQPLTYSTSKLREMFSNLNTHFEENWCAAILDATDDRLSLQGWDAKDQATNDVLNDLWNTYQIFNDADQVHRDALITTEAFIIAWKDADQIEVYANDPRMCHMFYEPDRPKVKRFAAKWWNDGAVWHITLYYADRLEYYIANSKNMPSTAGAFKADTPDRAVNPFGAIPVFHFQGPGELSIRITSLQDAVNKMLADMMVAAEFGAFMQRYVISQDDPLGALKNAPNEIWWIPAGDGQGQAASVGQFTATPLDNYTKAMDRFAASMAIISRTPKHYFYNAGASLSGEALLAMEAPLSKKVAKYQRRFGVTWQELAAFLLRITNGTDIPAADIAPVWEPPQSVQPLTEAQTLQTNTSAGIPLVTALKNQGWSEARIKAMEKDAQADQKKKTAMGQALLADMRQEQEQSNNPPVNGNGNNQQENSNGTK